MYVIHAVPAVGSMAWLWVSKEPGMPFTTMKDLARKYKTYAGAERAMEKLRKTAKHWNQVGNACEVYKIN